MDATIACVGPARGPARAAAARLGGRLPRARVEGFSLAGYLGAAAPPGRVVLCPAGRSLAADLAFLARVAERLLWPAPSGGFRDAIGGIRAHPTPTRPSPAMPGRTRASSRGLSAALLLEGPVGPGRVRAALRASPPRDWIVESARLVRLPGRTRSALARRGIRWSSLDPVSVIALDATPALARARGRWKALLPKATKIWIRGA